MTSVASSIGWSASSFPKSAHRRDTRASWQQLSWTSCAYLDETDLYEKVVNDLRFIRMTPIYFRPLDSSGQFRLDAEDVAYSVNVEFEPTLLPNYAYAPHLKDEPRTFKLVERFGVVAFMCLSLLLRDRYFPTLWRI